MNKYLVMVIKALITAAMIGVGYWISTGKLLQTLWVTLGAFVVYLLSDSVQRFLKKRRT